MKTPICKNCKHFYITWDPKFPYGCKALQFKSKVLPSIEVRKHSGFECLKYDPKENNKFK